MLLLDEIKEMESAHADEQAKLNATTKQFEILEREKLYKEKMLAMEIFKKEDFPRFVKMFKDKALCAIRANKKIVIIDSIDMLKYGFYDDIVVYCYEFIKSWFSIQGFKMGKFFKYDDSFTMTICWE